MNTTDLLINLIAAGAFVGYLTFMVIYATRNWRATAPGRSLMYAIGALNLLVLMATVHLFTGRYPGIEFVRAAVYTLLLLTAWRLVYSLIKSIRGGFEIDPPKLFGKKENK